MRKEKWKQSGAVRAAEGTDSVAHMFPRGGGAVALLLACAALAGTEPYRPHHCIGFSNLSQFREGGERAPLALTVHGQRRDVTVYWSGAASRAAAAVLQRVLSDALGLAGVSLQPAPPALCDLRLPPRALALLPAALLGGRPRCDLAARGLLVLREAAAPLLLRAHALLNREARADAFCGFATAATFYGNESALRRCGFLGRDEELSALTALVPAGVLGGEGDRADSLLRQSGLRAERVGRTHLARLVAAAERSFLFLDYDMWSDVSGVRPVRLPAPGVGSTAVFAASEVLRTFAPSLYDAILNFSIEPQHLRLLLQAEERPGAGAWDRAVCEQAAHSAGRLSFERHDYWIAVLVCEVDPDGATYNYIANRIGLAIWNITKSRGYGIGITKFRVDCSEPIDMNYRLGELRESSQWYRCIGAVVPAEGVDLAAVFATNAQLPLVAYGAVAHAVPGVGAPAGSASRLALAVREFVRRCGWRRLAVVSEPSATARAVSEALRPRGGSGGGPTVREAVLGRGGNSSVVLRALVAADARIFLVNGGWRTARAVLAEAARLRLTAERGYVWVALEWRGEAPAALRLFTVSFQCNATGSFSDALLSLGLAFVELVQRARHYRDDLRSAGAYSEFWPMFDEVNATGVCQPSLRYRGAALLAPRVFLTERAGSAARLLGTWLVYSDRVEPLGDTRDPYAGRRAPPDGTAPCFWPSGDAFAPDCLDGTVAGGGGALVLLSALVSAAAYMLKRRASRRRTLGLLSEEHRKRVRRERVVAALVDKLVDREALELREEIGAGRFGRVRLAVLRVPGRRPRALAAKALHEGAAPAEESEFLREACTLASLEHEHVVRLVGICATGGPPLVLMEHAFFGDLQQYLRARRHLAEGETEAAEAEHVSAGALTRLAREAAAALGYLAHRGLVHRDVRAANCLVDARRTLKLGDFGLARETCPKGAEGEPEYASQRRGIFPVLWMAPESLSRGAFSAASDVWAFGVLVLEVMTLGERPYGAWPPPRVVQHVLGGALPPLPPDATAQARGFALACWRQRACERPSAADLVAYLAEHPRVLAPALFPLDELGSVDSGFGEPTAPDRYDDGTHTL